MGCGELRGEGGGGRGGKVLCFCRHGGDVDGDLYGVIGMGLL